MSIASPVTADLRGERLSPFQLALFVLSILVLLALVVDALAPLDPEVSRVVQGTDTAVCGLFFLDWVIRFRRAPSRREFLRWGWIDLLACIPTVDAFRAGRLARVFQVLRILRGVRAGHRVVGILVQNKPRSAVASALLTLVVMISTSSAAVLVAERVPGANIRTAEDAVWWSVTTITTVGYGDRYPVTSAGRVVAMALMLSGVGLFGMLSGVVASLVAGWRSEDGRVHPALLERLERLEERLPREQD